MVDIDKEIANRVKDPNHYLLLALKSHPKYYQDFKRALSFLVPKLNEKQTERLLYEKLQISERPFAEKPFVQGALRDHRLCLLRREVFNLIQI